MVNPKFSFHDYAKELSKYADSIDVLRATSTSRKGTQKIRDLFVFWRNTYSEGNYYIGIIRDIIYLVALIPLALSAIGLPPTLTILLAMTYITTCNLIGYISYRFLALPRREKEMDDLMSMSRYLTYDYLKQVLTELKKIEVENTKIHKKYKKRNKK